MCVGLVKVSIAAVGTWTLMSFSAQAASQVDELISSLSNAKAQLEGRASRVQSCDRLRSKPVLEDLRSKFDDARNSHNARIDGWLFVIRTQGSKTIEGALEANKLGEARQRANAFLTAADQVLKASACTTKVFFLKEGVLHAINIAVPLALEGLVNLYKEAEIDPKQRAELVKVMEQQRIDEWRGVRSYVVYDWSTEEVIPPSQINQTLLRKASTAVYVNQWALEANPGKLVAKDKLAPDELSGAHLLYTGQIKDLKRITGSLKELEDLLLDK